MFTRAIVKKPGQSMVHGLRDSDLGEPDHHLALIQHAAYVEALKGCGLEVLVLEADERYPDSTFVEDVALLTATGVIMGTPTFASPDQLRGDDLDVRADIYSVGATLFTLLTGRAPFVADSVANLMYQIASAKPQPIRKLRPDLHASISRVISKVIEKKPEARYPTGKAMAEALLKCREHVVDEGGQSARKAAS